MIKRTITSIAVLALIIPVLIFGDYTYGKIAGQSLFLVMVSLLSFYAAYEINTFLLEDKLIYSRISSVITGMIMAFVLFTFFGLYMHEARTLGISTKKVQIEGI
jgi:uncharacterized membrane protein YgaE (UPF0421/DUF939 family)